MFDLKRFAEDARLSQTEVGSIIGVDQSVVSNMMSGKRLIRPHHIERLQAKYGDMISKYIIEDAVLPATMKPYPVESQPQSQQSAKVIEQPTLVPDSVVRRPDIDTLEWVADSEGEHSQHAFNIMNIMRRTRFVIQMNNNAMMPTLNQNEYVFLRPFAEGADIIDGEVYGVETRRHGILIRHLYHDDNAILARPKNAVEFGDIVIPDNEVVRFYHIVFHGSMHLTSLPNPAIDPREQMHSQNEQINQLITLLDKAGDRVDKSGDRLDRVIDMLAKK